MLIGDIEAGSPAPGWASQLCQGRAQLVSRRTDWLLQSAARGGRCVHSQRNRLAEALDTFLFGPQGVLTRDGSALKFDLQQPCGDDSNNQAVRPAEEDALEVQLEVEGPSDESGGRTLSSDVLEITDQRGDTPPLGLHSIELIEHMKQQLFSLRIGCESRCLRSVACFPWVYDGAVHVEQVVQLGGALGEHRHGGRFLAALCTLWPRFVATLMPLGRAEIVTAQQCVRLRAVLNYTGITEAYASVAELQRVRQCSISLFDRARTGLAALVEVRGDVVEITIGIKNGSWVYLDPSTGSCLQSGGSSASSTADAGVPVPSLVSGSSPMSIHVDHVKLQIAELGCASIGLPPLWLDFDHGGLGADSSSPSKGHAWEWRVAEMGSPGRIVEAMVRPFIDLGAYRAEVCRATTVRLESSPGEPGDFDKMRLLSSFPLPPLSGILIRFLRWWWSRQLAALDELRLFSDVCEALAQDLAAEQIDPDVIEGLGVDADTYYDARSNPDWFYDYQATAGIGRGARDRVCCLRACWRRCCCRRRRQNLFVSSSFHSLDEVFNTALLHADTP